MDVIGWIIIYLVVVNLISFAMMGIDKSRARKRAWRIPELHLFVVALIGGSVGAISGMYIFHHKTRHWYFVIGMPLILILQVAAVVALIMAPIEFTIF